MHSRRRSISPVWLVAFLGLAAFVSWSAHRRVGRIEWASSLGTAVQTEPTSATGYANAVRWLLVPEHNNASYQWIAQAQHAAATGDWRVRHVAYDNAPLGRETHLASPYRWWIELIAGIDRLFSSRAPSLAVEHAALWAGPVLQLLLLTATSILVAWHFGLVPAVVIAAALAFIFPLSGAFLPGQPDDIGLKATCGLWSILLLLAGICAQPAATDGRTVRRWFFIAGLVGGVGFWVNIACQLAVVGGIVLSALLANWLGRMKFIPLAHMPWRAWAVGGAIAGIIGWVVEYFPAYAWNLRLEANHPLYALAWLGAAELLMRTSPPSASREKERNGRHRILLGAAFAAIVAVPVTMLLTGHRGFPGVAAFPSQLTPLPNGPVAQNLFAWIARDGITAALVATLLPLALLAPATRLLLRRDREATTSPASMGRFAIAVGLGPVLTLSLLGCFALHWWSLVDGALLALLVVVVAQTTVSWPTRLAWGCASFIALLPGLVLSLPRAPSGADAGEVEALIERDLAHWLASRAPGPGAVVLAPPNLSAALSHYGGLGSVASPYWENPAGFAAAVRVFSSASTDEAQALVHRREIQFIVLPNWAVDLDAFAHLGAGTQQQSLLALLQQWLPPRWLRPIAYPLPGIEGLEGRDVAVFAVVEEQDNATALARLAEYFLETGRIGPAGAVAATLQRSYPSDLGALAACAHVHAARNDGANFGATLNAILPGLAEDSVELLPWERRVSLLLVLAQARRMKAARQIAASCLDGADPERLRSLSPGTLYRLLQFCRAAGVDFADPASRAEALTLLPAEWRGRF